MAPGGRTAPSDASPSESSEGELVPGTVPALDVRWTSNGEPVTTNKPTAKELSEQLGCRVDDLPWQTSGHGDGMFQVAIVNRHDGPTWVLVRLQGKPDVQVYSKHEWVCFLDGARRGEFDDLL